MPFQSLGLHAFLARSVKAMDFKEPTPIQKEAIPIALAGNDILGCAQTGSGKTVAFVLPLLHHLLTKPGPGLRALILVPTRELAGQVENAIRECGRFSPIRTAVIIGGVSINTQRHAVARGAQVLVATPGRLLDHLRQRHFRLDKVEQLVLDEADRMLDMGFLPDIRAILGQIPQKRQTQFFSATLHSEVEKVASFALRNPRRVEIGRPSTVAEGISQILYPVLQSQKIGLLLKLLKSTEMRSVLVFSRTKHGADKLANRLIHSGFQVGVLHSNRSQNQRTAAMESFRQNRIKILVATDIAARGIDVRNISHVVNFDVPRFPEDYVHRVGRTARAYGVGDAITLMDPGETSFVKGIERFINVVFPRAVLPDFQYNNPPRDFKKVFDSRPPGFWKHGKQKNKGHHPAVSHPHGSSNRPSQHGHRFQPSGKPWYSRHSKQGRRHRRGLPSH